MMAGKGLFKILADFFGEEVGSSFIAAALVAWLTGKKKESSAKDAPYVDIRGQLLSDILTIQPPLENIVRRHKQILADPTRNENEWVMLLAKVPHEVRKEVFPVLNEMGDEEFDQMIELLKHDALTAFCRRIMVEASPAFRRAWESIQPRFGQANEVRKSVGDTIHAYAGRVEHRREEVAWGVRRRPRSLRRVIFLGIGWALGLTFLIAAFAALSASC